MIANKLSSAKKQAHKALLSIQVAVLAVAGTMPFVLTASASAAPQLPNREARITTARPGQTFDITFEFDTTAVSSDVERIEIEFCDAPLGTCAITQAPTIPASSTPSQANWASGTAFGTYTRTAGDSGGTNNQIVVSRTAATSEGGGSNLQIGFTGLTHFGTANRSFYPRIRLYDDASAGTLQWEGVVAQSTSQTLTVNARVQEVLSFCVGATTTNDATSIPQNSVPANVNGCADMTGTDVDLGVVDSGAVSTTPVSTTNGGDNENGIAMIRTNAVNGAVIDYKAVQDTSSGKLKVTGATCSGTSTTDQCFNSQGTTQGTFTAGTENFGMTVAGVNVGSTTSYVAVYASGSTNLKPDAQYQGQGTFGSTYAFGTSNGFAWDDSGSADRIASSAASSVKVIDDEALILKFGATSSITTPTGQYTVQADFIATPTF